MTATCWFKRLSAAMLACGVALLDGGLDITPASAALAPPKLTAPSPNAQLTGLAVQLEWTSPPSATQYHLQVTPANGDGPGVDTVLSGSDGKFSIAAPPTLYLMLPDMGYTWRVRISDSPNAIPLDHSSWSPWAGSTFRTPKKNSSGLRALTPTSGEVVHTLTPVLQWNTTSEVFYYELQLSKDSSFNTDPATATAMVYSSLRHGGVTKPIHSYKVPQDAPLEDETTYYWRVRPRIQGDGLPVAWSSPFTFKTSTAAQARLTLSPVTFGQTAADPATCALAGAGSTWGADPALTDVYMAAKYAGAGVVALTLYRDGLSNTTLTVTLQGPSGCWARSAFSNTNVGTRDGTPLDPGVRRVEAWHAGELLAAAEFTITLPPSLQFGPLTLGTASGTGTGCPLSGEGTTFPAGTKSIVARYNRVTPGAAAYSVILKRGTTAIFSDGLTTSSDLADCIRRTLTPPDGFTAGAWTVDLVVNGQVVQSKVFTIA